MTGECDEGRQVLDAPLATLRALRDRLQGMARPAPALRLALDDALGAFAADDIVAPSAIPAVDLARADGYAVASMDLVGAQAFAPAMLSARPVLVEAGESMPPACDAVLDADCLRAIGPLIEAICEPTPGAGVRRAGEDCAAGFQLVVAGERLDAIAIAALRLAGVADAPVRRPRLRLVAIPPREGPGVSAFLLAAFAREAGFEVETVEARDRSPAAVAAACAGAACDLLLTVGGTGSGASDCAVAAMRDGGAVLAHGVALDPGRTAALGSLDRAPWIAAPGGLDGAVAVWLALVAPTLRRCAGAKEPPPLEPRKLSRKIASAVGLAQIVLVESVEGEWAPLATGDISLAQLVRADGYLLLDEGSEGFAAGALVRPLPMPGRRRA